MQLFFAKLSNNKIPSASAEVWEFTHTTSELLEA
jgi:hypothetical protein